MLTAQNAAAGSARSRRIRRRSAGRLFGCIPVNELSTSGFAGYTDRGAACEEVRLWSLYRGPTRNHVAINDPWTARLFVFFLAPGGWPAGDYTLVLRGKDDNAELPVRLR